MAGCYPTPFPCTPLRLNHAQKELPDVQTRRARVGQNLMPGMLCSVCKTEASKYTCPACRHRTCSLQCSSSHKKDVCTARPDLLAHIRESRGGSTAKPPARLNEDELYLDYRFLQHVASQVQRSPEQDEKGLLKRPSSLLNKRQKDLLRCVRQKHADTRLHFLPSVFSKAKANKSRAHAKTRNVYWTVGIVQEDGRETVKHDVLDGTPLHEIIGGDDPVCILDEQPGKRTARWIPVHPSDTLAQALAGVSIVEYPVLKACK